jgi:broad specificity phosphatase PhoE
MKLYLIRHGATEANLRDPPVLLGRRLDPPLAPLGVRQSEATRELLARTRLTRCYSSPLQRSLQTAAVVAVAHGLTPQPLEALTECDLGHWEGLDWPTIRERDPDAYARFLATLGHPGGETYREAHARAAAAVEVILEGHQEESVLVVSHHVVLRTYLAGLVGLPPDRAREVSIPNCAISTVVREGAQTRLLSLADAGHLANLEKDGP